MISLSRHDARRAAQMNLMPHSVSMQIVVLHAAKASDLRFHFISHRSNKGVISAYTIYYLIDEELSLTVIY